MSDSKEVNSKGTQNEGANLDHSSCGCGVIYLVGWAFNGRDGGKSLEVFLREKEDGDSFPVPIRKQHRQDVIDHFSLPTEHHVGFSAQVHLSDYDINTLTPGEYRIFVLVTGSDNTIIEREIGVVNIVWPEEIQSMESHHSEQVNYVAKKQSFLSRIWNGKLGSDKVLCNIYSEIKVTAANLVQAVSLIESGSAIDATLHLSPTFKVASLLKGASDNDGLIVILDHNFGGGANTFSTQTIKSVRENHNIVLRVWYEPNTSKVAGAVYYGNDKYEVEVGEINLLFQLLTAFPSFCLRVNSLYTWPYIELVLDNILQLRLFSLTKRLEFFGHDHMPICPSLFLLNDHDRYCAVPDNADICQSCLKHNTDEFKVFYPQEDIVAWRKVWRSLLLNTDYIRFFSQATYNEYLKAMPELKNSANVVVEGHRVESFGEEFIEKQKTDGITRIGIFGFLGKHKGSGVVNELADSISKGGATYRTSCFWCDRWCK